MNVWVVVAILWIHFVADFLSQSDWMATRKSHDTLALFAHTAVYCGCWQVAVTVLALHAPWFVLLAAVQHGLQDWGTSKATAALWKRNQRHWFFVVIGADQAVHLSALVLLYALLSVKP